jgi:MobA/MobL family
VREDLVFWNHHNLPQWSKDNPIKFFTLAEQYEGPKRTAFEEWRFSLPRELTRRQQMDVARDFLQAAFGTTHPYVWAFHAPRASDGGQQPHVHVLWSARTLDSIEREPAQFFKKYNRAHPERGGAEKDPRFHHFGSVKASRVLYCDVLNVHLEQAGHESRLHPGRLEARGFERAPEPVGRPSDSNAAKYHGEITERWQAILDHRATHAHHADAELADAQAYWQRRTVELGIHRDMPLALQLERIRQARESAITTTPEHVSSHELAQQVQRLEQNITVLEKYGNRLAAEHRTEQLFEARYLQPSSREQLRIERLLAEGREHGLPRDLGAERTVARLSQVLGVAEQEHDHQQGVSFRARIFGKDREQERDQGMDMGIGF